MMMNEKKMCTGWIGGCERVGVVCFYGVHSHNHPQPTHPIKCLMLQ